MARLAREFKQLGPILFRTLDRADFLRADSVREDSGYYKVRAILTHLFPKRVLAGRVVREARVVAEAGRAAEVEDSRVVRVVDSVEAREASALVAVAVADEVLVGGADSARDEVHKAERGKSAD